jgi:peptidyl-prolyl cis-trans isomerase SDCCAG10
VELQDEFHSRLKFHRRGLLAMANGGKDDNAQQFFLTLDRADNFNKKNTIFGTVNLTGNTLYNLLDMADVRARSHHTLQVLLAWSECRIIVA